MFHILNQDQNETFSVLIFHPKAVDISVDLPRRISPSASHLSGSIAATYAQSGVPVWGNLSLSAEIVDKGNLGTTASSEIMLCI